MVSEVPEADDVMAGEVLGADDVMPGEVSEAADVMAGKVPGASLVVASEGGDCTVAEGHQQRLLASMTFLQRRQHGSFVSLLLRSLVQFHVLASWSSFQTLEGF